MPRRYEIPNCPPNCQGWHNIEQTAAILSIRRWMVYKLIRDGRLQAEDRGLGGKRICHAEISRLMRERENS